MTSKDSDMLSTGLKMSRKLKRLWIRNSIVDDDKFYAIYDGLRNITRLGEERMVWSFRVWIRLVVGSV